MPRALDSIVREEKISLPLSGFLNAAILQELLEMSRLFCPSPLKGFMHLLIFFRLKCVSVVTYMATAR